MASPKAPLKFQGKRNWPLGDKVDDWNLTPEQQETKVEQFRLYLESKNAWDREQHDYHTMLRFLRARKYDLDAAGAMWQAMLSWRGEHKVDTLLEGFHFHEKEQFLMCYPQGYHKVDKMGRPVYIQHLGSINLDKIKEVTSEERMIKFHIQEYERCIHQILPICSHLQGQCIDQTFGILDIKGVGLGHLTGEVKRILGIITKYDQDNYPEMMGHVCIINAPYLFRPIWSLIKPLLDARTQAKIEICSSNYVPELLKWIDAENLPEYLGGKSRGTLLDDVGPWSDPTLLRTLDLEALHIPRCLWPPEAAAPDGPAALEGSTPFRSIAAVPPLPQAAESLAGEALYSAASSGSMIIYTDDDGGAFYSPKSEASFMSLPSPSEPNQPLLPSAANGTATTSGRVRTPSSLIGSDLPMDDLAYISIDDQPSEIPPRTQSILDRVRELEAELPKQKERLKEHLAATAPNGSGLHTTHSVFRGSAGARSGQEGAVAGTLLWRIETLEEGMDLLLAAQQLCWGVQPRPSRARDRCCGGCCTM